MNVVANIIWIIFGGFAIALEYLIAGILMFITIVGIPFGVQSFKLASASLWPFGKDIQSTPDTGSGVSTLLNVIWILLGGIWITITHLVLGPALCVTIIGIAFGLQHFKLMKLSFTPFGYAFGNVQPGAALRSN